MGFRFRKGLSLLPGVRLNFSKSGASLSLGGRGMSVNLSPSGVRTTVGVPGSGMSYRSPTYKWSKLAGAGTPSPAQAYPKPATVKLERLRTLRPDPRRYSQTNEECRRLTAEKPAHWEWYLVLRLLSERLAVLKEDWENATWGKETPRYPQGARDAVRWLQKQASDLEQIAGRLSATFKEDRILEAFGPPGVAGDPDKIVDWADSVCGDLAACVDLEREIQTLRWYPQGGELLAAMTGWSLCVVRPFYEMLPKLEQQLAVVDQTNRLELMVKLEIFDGSRAIEVLKKTPVRTWNPFPKEGEKAPDTGGPGGFEPPRLEYGGGDGGSGDNGPKVFFDDGQVRVTEHLVTIGPPWNKAFAVSEIRSVRCGENEGNKLQKSFLQGIGWLFLGGGALMGVWGLWIGTVFCGITGLSLIFTQPAKDGPYGVTISMGGFWESEYLSTANLEWAGAVAQAIQEAMNYSRQPRSGGQGGEFIYLNQEKLRN